MNTTTQNTLAAEIAKFQAWQSTSILADVAELAAKHGCSFGEATTIFFDYGEAFVLADILA
jgi:hypothetical protein